MTLKKRAGLLRGLALFFESLADGGCHRRNGFITWFINVASLRFGVSRMIVESVPQLWRFWFPCRSADTSSSVPAVAHPPPGLIRSRRWRRRSPSVGRVTDCRWPPDWRPAARYRASRPPAPSWTLVFWLLPWYPYNIYFDAKWVAKLENISETCKWFQFN